MKAQIQLGESIFVVFIVIILIVFGIVFYSQIQREDIQDEDSNFADLETVTITQYATSLTELKCSLQEIQYPNCFDQSKLDAFEQLVEQTGTETYRQFYFSQLGNSKLVVREVYPDPTKDPWVIYENNRTLDPTVPQDRVLQAQANIPVNIYHPVTGTYAFGILEITEYR